MKKKHTKELMVGLSYINRLLNISSHEWPKVVFCFLLKLFADTGKVIGHTVLLTMVATRLGMSFLPVVYIISGICIALGTSFVAQIMPKISKKEMLIGLAGSAGVLLLLARILLILDLPSVHAAGVINAPEIVDHVSILSYVFFVIILIAEGFFFVQMEICLALYIEGFFTPMESQRAFPIIESAAVVASFFSGIVLAFAHVSAENQLILWGIMTLLIIPTIYIYTKYSEKVPLLQFHEHEDESNVPQEGVLQKLQKEIRVVSKTPFLKVTAMMVFCYYIGYYLLEYQFTKAITETAGSEQQISQFFGWYILLFSGVGVILQLLVSSRIIKKLGIIQSLKIHPYANIIGYTVLFTSMNTLGAFASKILSDGSGIIYKNAYLSSFYAVNHQIRESAKALIEGWLFPAGLIFSTFILLVIKLLPRDIQPEIITICLIGVSICSLILLQKQQKYYSNLPILALRKGEHSEKFEAIEILSEQGHTNNTDALMLHLRNWKNNDSMIRAKIKILQTLGILKEESTIPVILDVLDDQSVDVQVAAVESLSHFQDLGTKFMTQTFARHRVITSLESLFRNTDSVRLRKAIIRVYANMHIVEVIPLLLELLDSDDLEIRSDCISIMKQFNDPNIYHYLKDFLHHEHPRLRANALVALWQFKQYRLELITLLTQLITTNTDKETRIEGIYALGELKSLQEEKYLLNCLDEDDEEIVRHAAISLAKLDNIASIPHIINNVFHEKPEIAVSTFRMLRKIPGDFRKKITDILHQEVSHRISTILHSVNHNIENLSKETLLELIALYELVGKDSEIIKLENILKKK